MRCGDRSNCILLSPQSFVPQPSRNRFKITQTRVRLMCLTPVKRDYLGVCVKVRCGGVCKEMCVCLCGFARTKNTRRLSPGFRLPSKPLRDAGASDNLYHQRRRFELNSIKGSHLMKETCAQKGVARVTHKNRIVIALHLSHTNIYNT